MSEDMLDKSKLITKSIAILEYPLVLLLILTSNTVYFRAYGTGEHRYILLSFFIILLLMSIGSFAMIIHYQKVHHVINQLIIFTIPFVIFLLLNNMHFSLIHAKGSVLILYFIPFLSFFYFYFRVKSGMPYHLFIKFEKIMTILSVVSLALWMMGPVTGIIKSTGLKSISWGRVVDIPSYYGIFFNAQGQASFLGLKIVRNTGIFCEAPMFSYVITVALLINLFIRKRIGTSTVILLITLISTTSTTGVIIAIAALMIKGLMNDRVYHILFKWKFVLIPLIGIIGTLLISFLIIKKMQDNFGSYSTRLNDFYACYRAWINHPLIGNGLGNYQSYEQYMLPSRLLQGGNNGMSTGFMRTLADGGLFLMAFYLTPVFLFIKKYWQKSNELIIFSVFTLVLFIVTIIDFNYLFLMIVTWMWAQAMSGDGSSLEKKGV